MDCLPMERQRGITIKAAAIWFVWNGNRINFIDTPGHADFVFEVERALSVMDGAIVLLDAIAGVEAQTVHIWRRAASWRLPKLIFINKMDRPGADSTRALVQLQHQLGARPVPMQVPIFDKKSGNNDTFCGLIDVIRMESLFWSSVGDSTMFTRKPLPIIPGQDSINQVVSARTLLIETLAEIDENLIDAFLASDCDPLQLDSDSLQQAVRRATLSNYLIPVFYGSALKNIGIQPLLDAMVAYLPSTKERQDVLELCVSSNSSIRSISNIVSTENANVSSLNTVSVDGSVFKKTVSFIEDTTKSCFEKHVQFGNISQAYTNVFPASIVHLIDICRGITDVFAIAFKVIVEREIRYVYVSVRKGYLRKGQQLRIMRGNRMHVGQLFEGLGGTIVLSPKFSVLSQSMNGINKINTGPSVDKIEEGNWGIMICDDRVRTGDIFLDDMNPKIDLMINHVANLKIYDTLDVLTGSMLDSKSFFGLEFPAPVLTVALEPIGTSTMYSLSRALIWLLDEDPSLKVNDNDGQLLLSGIGELHIETACDRLRNHFCVDFQVGIVQLCRWEKVLTRAMAQKTYETSVRGRKLSLDVKVCLEPINNQKKLQDNIDNKIVICNSVVDLYSYLGPQKVKNACISGISAGLLSGPIEGLPVSGVKVILESVNAYGAAITSSILGSAVRFTVSYLVSTLPKHSVSVIEPIMQVIVILPYEKDIGNVVKDLTSLRQGKLVSMEGDPTGQHVLVALVSLRHMLEYTTVLRGLTGGTGSFAMVRINEALIRDLFKDIGNITTVNIPMRRSYKTGGLRPQGIAFVTFSSKEDAQKAIDLYDQKEYLDRALIVTYANPPRSSNRRNKGLRSGSKSKKTNETQNSKETADPKSKKVNSVTDVNSDGSASGAQKKIDQVNSSGTAGTESDNKHNRPRFNRPGLKRGPKGPPANGVDSKTTVFVAGLSYDTKTEQLIEWFSEYNPLSAHVALRPIPRYMIQRLQARGEQRKGRGFGFVTFENEDMQSRAVKEMNDKEIDGRKLTVKIAVDKPQSISAVNGSQELGSSNAVTD
ncbi:hypothetical protein PMAC_002177 [Pneumocystis sp. 'macacae']|nr:hypothetical protein PMAC_002177 [Pneumocystis sp. 'macacae']